MYSTHLQRGNNRQNFEFYFKISWKSNVNPKQKENLCLSRRQKQKMIVFRPRSLNIWTKCYSLCDWDFLARSGAAR